MKEITWTEAFFSIRGTKQLRQENNIILPDEYLNSQFKVGVSIAIWYLIGGVLIGITIGELI